MNWISIGTYLVVPTLVLRNAKAFKELAIVQLSSWFICVFLLWNVLSITTTLPLLLNPGLLLTILQGIMVVAFWSFQFRFKKWPSALAIGALSFYCSALPHVILYLFFLQSDAAAESGEVHIVAQFCSLFVPLLQLLPPAIWIEYQRNKVKSATGLAVETPA